MESNTSTPTNDNNHNHNEAGREWVVTRQQITVRGLSALGVGTVYTIASTTTTTTTTSWGSTDSLLPTDDDDGDDQESLRPPPPDLSIEVIEGLLNKVEVIDNGDVCAICMDELKVNDEARAIGHCSHTFHLDCVAEWVKRKPTCPLCRFEIPINGEGDDDQRVKRRRLI